MRMKPLLLVLGSLLLMFGLSGCSMIKGTRANIEKQFEVLSEIYPTKNVNDLRKKFPKGFRLVNSQNIDDMTYSVILENNSPTSEITGRFMVEQDNSETGVPDLLLEVNLEVDNAGEIHSKQDVPEEYQEVLDNFTFLFETLDLSKEKVSTFEYKRHRTNANDGYSIAYLQNKELLPIKLRSEEEKVQILFRGQFNSDLEDKFEKNITIGTGENYIYESFRSERMLNEK